MKTIVSIALATLFVAAASQALAAGTTINVVETGEGGSAMGLTLEPSTVKAGPATFHVHNGAMTEEHEMLVVKLSSPDEKLPVNTKKHRIDEDTLKSLGEVADLKPGMDGEMSVTLMPGTYLVFCNIKGHYEAGMQNKLTVTK